MTALALKHRFASSKHQPLIGWFNKTFLKENIIEKRYGQFLHRAYDRRSRADYADYVKFEKEEITAMYVEMKDFVKKIEELVHSDIHLPA